MFGRYELDAWQWEIVRDLVERLAKRTGRPLRDDRVLLNGMFWVLCSGATWRDLPERYGPWQTVYNRFRALRDDGTLDVTCRAIMLPVQHERQEREVIKSLRQSKAYVHDVGSAGEIEKRPVSNGFLANGLWHSIRSQCSSRKLLPYRD